MKFRIDAKWTAAERALVEAAALRLQRMRDSFVLVQEASMRLQDADKQLEEIRTAVKALGSDCLVAFERDLAANQQAEYSK